MDRVRQRIIERVSKYGLRVVCAACGWAGRHFPVDGRVRAATCKACQREGTLTSQAWADTHQARWDAIVDQWQKRLRPFSRV